ncbi:MAG: tyrosine-type recombinase/integrase [Acidimicrobiaceae bacterium]|nr:tyrosine-type recombinase/integrase [Acidimicrobiaceae bacterium]
MAEGSIFRRCTRKGCRARLGSGERRCGGAAFTWSFVVDLPSADGKRRQRWGSGFRTREAAQVACDRIRADVRDQIYIERSSLTVGDYLDSWWNGGDWKGNTRRDYRVCITRHIKPRIGNLPLQRLTRQDAKALYQSLLTGGNVRTGGGLSRKSVLNVHRCLRAALNDAVRDGLIRANPALGAFSYSKSRERKEMLTWTVEEVQQFLKFVREKREHALYHLALATGMRRGELLGLRRRDLDLSGARLRVRQQWTKDGDAGRRFITLKTGTHAWRTIDLDDLTVQVLLRHLGNQEFERRSRGESYKADLDLVFCKPDGSPYDPDETTRRFERRAASCPGVLRIHFHDMRHTHATLLLEGGESVKYVAERLGDREETVVETYAHVTPRMRSSAVSKIRGFLGADSGNPKESVVRPRASGDESFREPPVSSLASEGDADLANGA